PVQAAQDLGEARAALAQEVADVAVALVDRPEPEREDRPRRERSPDDLLVLARRPLEPLAVVQVGAQRFLAELVERDDADDRRDVAFGEHLGRVLYQVPARGGRPDAVDVPGLRAGPF